MTGPKGAAVQSKHSNHAACVSVKQSIGPTVVARSSKPHATQIISIIPTDALYEGNTSMCSSIRTHRCTPVQTATARMQEWKHVNLPEPHVKDCKRRTEVVKHRCGFWESKIELLKHPAVTFSFEPQGLVSSTPDDLGVLTVLLASIGRTTAKRPCVLLNHISMQ